MFKIYLFPTSGGDIYFVTGRWPIKTVVIGRKNYLFSTSLAGAEANAIIYSVIETAKEHGLNVYKYLTYLFEHLPNVEFLMKPKLLEDFLPWAKNVQEHCKGI